MRRSRLLLPLVLGITAVLAACLSAPDEPGSTASGLSCAAGQRAFNGACRQICKTGSDCAAGLSCMHVGAGETLCLDYKSCAHLGSDTACGRLGGGYGPYSTPYDPYDPYGSSDPYTPYDPYGPPGASCAGNATWSVVPASGSTVQCAASYDVQRCQLVAGRCTLVGASVSEIAEP